MQPPNLAMATNLSSRRNPQQNSKIVVDPLNTDMAPDLKAQSVSQHTVQSTCKPLNSKSMRQSRSLFGLLVAASHLIANVSLAQDLSFEQLLNSTAHRLQTERALRNEHGEGLARNFDWAIQLYCQAPWNGDVDAQYQLGWIYANGRGVERSDKLATGWFALAAAQGDIHAERILGRTNLPDGGHPARCYRPNGEEVMQLPVSYDSIAT